jgi:hypothetical protein
MVVCHYPEEVVSVKDTVDHLQKRLETEGDKIAGFFLEIDDPDWKHVIYNSDTKWTLLHVLKHFVSVEQAFQWLIQDVLDGGMGAPEDFEIDEFNEAEVGRFLEYQPVEMIQTFQKLRRDSISLAGTLSADDLEKRGNHPYFGNTTLKKILRLLYTHNSMHMRDVRRALRG